MVIKTIKNQLRKKQLLTALISLGIACVVIVGGIWALSSSQVPITYEAGNVSVAEQDGRLYFQLTANRMYPIKDYLLLPADETNESDALYFCFYTTHWDQVFGGDSLTLLTDQPFANETNLGQDKRISKIYYYTGDYTQLKNSVAAQQDQAVLLWREG